LVLALLFAMRSFVEAQLIVAAGLLILGAGAAPSWHHRRSRRAGRLMDVGMMSSPVGLANAGKYKLAPGNVV
jgi:hypothetical protein